MESANLPEQPAPRPAIDVLVVEDDPADVHLFRHELHRAGFDPSMRVARTEQDYRTALRQGAGPDVILAGDAPLRFGARRALEILRALDLDIPLLVVSGALDGEAGSARNGLGADDHLPKDRLIRLGHVVRQALANQRLRAGKQAAELALAAASAKLLASGDELARLDRDLARACQDLEQFVYAASHDLQEPLRQVAGFCQLLERRYGDKLDGAAKEFIAFAVDGTMRMQRQIAGLVELSRIGRDDGGVGPVELDTVLHEAKRNLHPVIESSGARITADPLPVVDGNARRLRQLLEHLLRNAVTYHGDQAPEVHVTAEREVSAWRVCVSDNGIGIEPPDDERIFQAFRHTRMEGPGEGAGLGLAICKRIVERHGGRIWVESKPGSGSAFHWTIPVTGDDA